jgi:hypothetical protein
MNKPVIKIAYFFPPSSLVIRQIKSKEKAPQRAEAKCNDFIEYPKIVVNNFKNSGVGGNTSGFSKLN